jgi:NADH-quinone oxidoreductase subunit J
MLAGNLNGLLFYAFSAVLTLSAFFAAFSRRSVHSVLFLVLAFFAAAWIFLTRGAEFIAMMLIIIYVGAVAVLFLFVVMMLEEPNAEVKKFKRGKLNFAFSAFIGIALFLELFAILSASNAGIGVESFSRSFSIKDVGAVLYTERFVEFQAAGFLFFAAMVGAIVLTLFNQNPETKTKRQNFFKQIAREKTTIHNAKPAFRSGVKVD